MWHVACSVACSYIEELLLGEPVHLGVGVREARGGAGGHNDALDAEALARLHHIYCALVVDLDVGLCGVVGAHQRCNVVDTL